MPATDEEHSPRKIIASIICVQWGALGFISSFAYSLPPIRNPQSAIGNAMAGFRMHVTTSTVLGCGYAGVSYIGYGVPAETAVVAGAMCGFAGMLPDLDSDYGVPLRETMAFTAAILPMLLVGRLQTLELSHDSMVLVAVSMYLFIRFGVTNMIRKFTVHRGMFHSFPAMFIFAGIAFLACGSAPIEMRCYKAGGVMAGFLSHLVLDEIYAVEYKSGRWRFKKSFGTAMKFWCDDGWANFSTYAKLAIVIMLILGDPTVVERLETDHPQFAGQIGEWRNRIGAIGSTLPTEKSAAPAGDQFPFAPVLPWQSDVNTAQRPNSPNPQ